MRSPVANARFPGPPGIIWVDHARGCSARRRHLTLRHRSICAIEVVVDEALVDLNAKRVAWIISLSLRRRGTVDRAGRQNCQNRTAHQNLHTNVELASPRPALRGEVGLLSNPGEGDSPRTQPVETAPHPDPLPARAGRGRETYQIFSSTGTSSGFTPDSDNPLTNHSRIWPMPRL